MTNSYTKDRESVISGNTTFETIVQQHIGNINANSSMNAFLLLNDNAIQLYKETDKYIGINDYEKNSCFWRKRWSWN